ncbi:MAG: DoxX family membrane protein [Saprospiraceae bacterium]|nr:DoxX family membrane protein [Saprospiraceae bacterium]
MAYSKTQLTALVILRMLIGWHFLYEGMLKLFTPEWTSMGYLRGAQTFTGLFSWLASESMINLVDGLTIAVLIAVGLSLLLGLFTRIGVILGMLIMAMFYLAQPAWPGMAAVGQAEGNYLIVTKNLIELAALWVVFLFPTSVYVGLDMYLTKHTPAALA